MKILLDARMYGLEHAGIGRYLINLIDELAKIDRKNRYALLLRKKYYNKLKLPDNWKKVLADFRHYTFSEQLNLPRIISAERPGIVHFPHFNIPVFWIGKFVVTIHDMSMHRQRRDATKLPLPIYYFKRLPYKYAFSKAVKSSLKIIVPSNAVKDEVVRYYAIEEDKVKVTYEGLDDKFKEIDFKKSESRILKRYNLEAQKYFIYLGNVYPHKNLERAIEAVVAINQNSDQRILLAIASSRSVFTERLEKVIKGLQAQKYVKLLGFVPDDNLGFLLKNSIAFVYPSLSEGFGLQGLESIAAGTLLLASDIPVFKEVYKGNAIYFNPYDFTTIRKAMSDAMNMDNKEREKIIKNGQKFIKRYSWAKMAKQTLKLYEDSARL